MHMGKSYVHMMFFFQNLENLRIQYVLRHMPADSGHLYAAAESRQLSRILALLGGPREARGRLTAPGALRRRPPSAAAALRAAGPRFARPG